MDCKTNKQIKKGKSVLHNGAGGDAGSYTNTNKETL